MSGAPDGGEEPLVDEAALRKHLEGHLPLDGPANFAVERHQAGHSNETFFVTWGGREYALRRPPRGAFLPTAHDVLREHRILKALDATSVRAPRVVLACEDESVIGAPFYLMERVRGVVIRDDVPKAFDTAEARARIGDELVDALAEIHNVGWQTTDLAGIAKHDGYVERQIRRWMGQMELTLPHTAESRPVPELEEVGDWLAANVPETQRTTLVHGDYKLDNVMFAQDEPRVVSVLDWEMSTLGDPLADLGWMLSFWRESDDPSDGLLSATPRMTELPGFRSRRALVERYEAATGLKAERLGFYQALAVWKLAILLEGSYARHLWGMTDDPFFAEMEHAVPALARHALDLTRGD